jgi:hypothetical protein
METHMKHKNCTICGKFIICKTMYGCWRDCYKIWDNDKECMCNWFFCKECQKVHPSLSQCVPRCQLCFMQHDVDVSCEEHHLTHPTEQPKLPKCQKCWTRHNPQYECDEQHLIMVPQKAVIREARLERRRVARAYRDLMSM